MSVAERETFGATLYALAALSRRAVILVAAATTHREVPMRDRYDEIFADYVKDMRAARARALAWWQTLGAGSAQTRARWPAGPSSHPAVLAVYRKHYLDIVEHNERALLQPEVGAVDRELPPTYLLLERLEEDAPDLDTFLVDMVMLPAESPLRDSMKRPALGAPPRVFKFETNHRVDEGIERLMTAPRDLPPTGPVHEPPRPVTDATAEHRALFLEYRRDLETALTQAEAWWGGLVAWTSGLFSRKRTRVANAYAGFAAGPAGCLEVLGVLHSTWLRCVAVNQAQRESDAIRPEVMLLSWLMDGRHDSWVQCLSGLPYWPIGLDGDDHWV